MKASRMTGTGLLVAASATALVVGLNVGSSAAPHAAGQRSFASMGSMQTTAAAVSKPSSNIHTFIAGRPRERILDGLGIWTVDVKPGLYDVSFKAILGLTQPDATHPGQVICGALDLQTLGQTQSGVPWIYTVDTAESGVSCRRRCRVRPPFGSAPARSLACCVSARRAATSWRSRSPSRSPRSRRGRSPGRTASPSTRKRGAAS